jgi:hypothetical protein
LLSGGCIFINPRTENMTALQFHRDPKNFSLYN